MHDNQNSCCGTSEYVASKKTPLTAWNVCFPCCCFQPLVKDMCGIFSVTGKPEDWEAFAPDNKDGQDPRIMNLCNPSMRVNNNDGLWGLSLSWSAQVRPRPHPSTMYPCTPRVGGIDA